MHVNPVICHAAWQICFNQSEAPLRSGWSCIISLEILCSFLRCHFMGKPMEHEKTVDVAMPTNDPKETLFTLLCRLNFLFSGGNVLTEISVPFVETHI